ncbi:MAG: DUF1501 domain-containing protein [Gemmataceae bacterium]
MMRGLWTRRALLRVGGLGLLGLAGWLRLQATASANRPRVRSVILLQHYGAPSHIDLWDPKPDAPVEIRGEFSTLATSLPGYRVTEIMPHIARICHRLTIVRSMHHRVTNHNPATYQALTGYTPERDQVQVAASSSDWPALGAVLARFRAHGQIGPTAPFVQLPHVAFDQVYKCPGQGGGWLGKKYDPLILVGDPSRPDYRADELYLPADLPVERLEDRRTLLQTVEARLRRMEHIGLGHDDAYYQRAFAILAAPATRRALDLSAEPPAVRDRYGRNKVGQSYLLARRLVEAGVHFVTCFNGSNPADGWDTHANNFAELKHRLMPADDLAFSALIEDLHVRGLLDSTLVIWAGEFGRKPHVAQPGPTFVGKAGRDHWPYCYSIVLAGGGVRQGMLYGASDRFGAYPQEKPVTPADLAATVYWALGIDPHAVLTDQAGRPLTLTSGTPIQEWFG